MLERVVRSTLGSRTRVNCVGSSPTHWVLTCTISEWHCESRARLYVCTYSYNRYCFNDDYLPTWFADDEKKHFRPQLPVDKDTVERIKSQFRDIAARPIKKVGCRRLLLLVPPLFACMLPWAVTGCSHVPSAPPPQTTLWRPPVTLLCPLSDIPASQVAEARARKKQRAVKKMDKLKKQAAAIAGEAGREGKRSDTSGSHNREGVRPFH